MISRKYPGTSTAPQFADLFTTALPRGLREQTAGMTPHDAFHIYGQSGGPLRLGNWQCTDGARSGAGLGPQARNYQATIAFDDHVTTTTATAAGPVAALTAMLHDGGVAVEMLGFHQLHSGEHTATFIYGSNGTRAEWAIGWSADATDSALRAVIACANRLSA